MAIPKPEPRDWQLANAQVLQVTDREVLAVLRNAKKNVDKLLSELPSGKSEIRRAQLEQSRARLLAEQATVFQRLGDVVAARRAQAASRSARLSAAADAALLRAVGKGEQGQFLYESALQVSQRAIDTALARLRLSALPLSRRIYNTSVWMGGRLSRLISETMATGLNAQEFAKKARDWFNPNTPGGIRYAAMRLARTEINNAFHAMSAEKYATTPWVTKVDWNLSKSHPKPDICNEVHAESPFPKDAVPARPHPQCMCYITPATVSEDEFIDRFIAGDYDAYLDRELEAAGWQEEAKPEPKPTKAAGTNARTPEKRITVSAKPTARRNDPAYKKDYERGWKAGAGRNDLTRADKRGEPPAYYDGFSDRSIGVPKWTRADERDELDSQIPVKISKDGYSPGNWQRAAGEDREAQIQELMDEFRVFKKNAADEELRKLAVELLEETTSDSDVLYRNGPHEVVFKGGNLSAEQHQRFLSHFDTMQSKFPTGRKMAIRVEPSTQFGHGVGGETTLATGYMRINEKVMQQDFWPGMPVSSGVPSALYVLAHEWGHAFPDKGAARDTHVHHDAVAAGGMSKYGTRGGANEEGHAAEGYAEAFAEWSLTEGKTTNKAAQEYAKRFNWGERFGA